MAALASPTSLDRFAPSYIPQWQRIPPNYEQIISLPAYTPVSSRTYSNTLYPTPLLQMLDAQDRANMEACANHWATTLQSLPPRSSPSTSTVPNGPRGATGAPPIEFQRYNGSQMESRVLPALTPAIYVTRSILLQDSEYHARLMALRNSSLWAVPLTPIKVSFLPDSPSGTTSQNRDNRSAPENETLYSIEAPHIRENYPPVSIFDIVWLRQLRPATSSMQGIAFEARVHSIQRIRGVITIRCDALQQPGMWESGIFNVDFVPQSRQFTLCRLAMEFMHKDIAGSDLVPAAAAGGAQKNSGKDTGQGIRTLPRSWLFPQADDCITADSDKNLPMDWMDSQLNDEQKLAVKSIVHGKHGIPYLISGPPGTGKTKTIVEAIFQILEHHPTTHILVCGASNSSADTLATRLSRKLGSHALFRLNDPSRPMNEVRIGLQPWCHHENGLWALPPIKDLLSKSVIVTSCVDASLLFSARCTNAALSILEDHFTSHLHSNAHIPPPPFPTRQHFGFLLIDEAAQASEMELCIPLSVVAPAPTFYRTGQPIPAADLPHVTICGDTKQLGPRIESADCRNHDMDVSLLERLFERDVYKNSPFSRKAMRMQRLAKQQPVIGHKRRKNGTVEERHPVQGISIPFCNLTKNYRSHPAILMLPSTLFYEDTLVAYAAPEVQNSPLRGWPALRTSDFPFLFVGKTTPEEWTDQRLSYYNSGEIGEIISIVTGLLGKSEPTAPYFLPAEMRGKLLASEISVISPFREQVWRVRQALRTLGLAAVDVGDVESLQGAENRVVIVSTVRSSSRFLAEDQRMNRGVIFEAKRFNVALTRAKELLIVVGNADVLRVDPWWKLLLTFAMRNNAYIGPPITSIDRASVDAFSRLEEEWNLKHATDKVKKTPHQPKATLRPEVVSYPSSSAGTATAGGSTPESLGAQTIADEEYMPGECEDDDEGDTTQGFVIAGSLVREALQEDFDFDI